MSKDGGFHPIEDTNGMMKKIAYGHCKDVMEYTLALYNNETLTDCQLISKEGIAISVHKFVLTQCSQLWGIIVNNSCCNGSCQSLQESVVMFPDVKWTHLQLIVNFLYTGTLEGTQEDRKHIKGMIKMLGISGNVLSTKEGYLSCPNCDAYLHKNEMLNHLIKVHVREPYHKDLEAYKVNKDTHSPLSCTECANRKIGLSGKIHHVQFLADNPIEDLINHYKDVHFDYYCKYAKDKCGIDVDHHRERRFDRDVLQDDVRYLNWRGVLPVNPVKSPGVIAPPRHSPKEDDSKASDEFSGGIDSEDESESEDQCEKCKEVFPNNASLREHRSYKCQICSRKISFCLKESHEEKHATETHAKKGVRKRRKSAKSNKTPPPLPVFSSESSDDDVKPTQSSKRKRKVLDSDDDIQTKKPRSRRPSKSSKVVLNGENSDSDTAMPNNSSGIGKKICKEPECKGKMISTDQFRRHVVTHLYHWWDQDVPKETTKCTIEGCTHSKKDHFANWKRIVSHLALYHKELEIKMKQHNTELKDFERPMPPQANDILSNNVRSNKPEVIKSREYDQNGLLTLVGLRLGPSNEVAMDSNLDDNLASNGPDMDDILASSGSNHENSLHPCPPPNGSNRPTWEDGISPPGSNHPRNLDDFAPPCPPPDSTAASSSNGPSLDGALGALSASDRENIRKGRVDTDLNSSQGGLVEINNADEDADVSLSGEQVPPEHADEDDDCSDTDEWTGEFETEN